MRPGQFATGDRRSASIAIVGGGVSGMAAAYALSAHHRVTLFEAAPALGGHSRTILAGPCRNIPVDTGFMVFNYDTYPRLTALFAALDVPVKPAPMTFSVSLDDGAFEYGISDPRRLLADPRNAASPRFWRMIGEILRFNASAAGACHGPDVTLGELLSALGMSADFWDRYLYPLAGAIWSTAREDMDAFPAQSFVDFFRNHRLLSAARNTQWWTVDGGSHEYVSRLQRALAARGVRIRTACPVAAVGRSPFPWVRAHGGEREPFDAIVMACHADQTLALLSDPAPEESTILGALRYRPNRAILHGDARHMPRRPAAWSSWNYRGRSAGREADGAFTYWMNALQGLDRRTPLFVTLNPAGPIDERLVYDETIFEHPQFDLGALAAQQRLPAIQGARATWFAGAYARYGFHEDGAASGFEAARLVNASLPAAVRTAA